MPRPFHSSLFDPKNNTGGEWRSWCSSLCSFLYCPEPCQITCTNTNQTWQQLEKIVYANAFNYKERHQIWPNISWTTQSRNIICSLTFQVTVNTATRITCCKKQKKKRNFKFCPHPVFTKNTGCGQNVTFRTIWTINWHDFHRQHWGR